MTNGLWVSDCQFAAGISTFDNMHNAFMGLHAEMEIYNACMGLHAEMTLRPWRKKIARESERERERERERESEQDIQRGYT